MNLTDPLREIKSNILSISNFYQDLGFYGFGLIHMIGGLSRTATASSPSIIRCRNFI
jgi:hypothetical protein